MNNKETQSNDPIKNSEKKTLVYPKYGDCHLRIPKYEWDIISMICDTRACSINEAICWIIRTHISRAKDPEMIADMLLNIGANVDDIITYLEDIQTTSSDLTNILTQGNL
jgi:hypothetical protein